MMKSIFFDQKLKIKEIPRPQAIGSEALIKVELAGLCNTDLELCRGYMDFTGVLGHEFVGTFE